MHGTHKPRRQVIATAHNVTNQAIGGIADGVARDEVKIECQRIIGLGFAIELHIEVHQMGMDASDIANHGPFRRDMGVTKGLADAQGQIVIFGGGRSTPGGLGHLGKQGGVLGPIGGTDEVASGM